MTARLEPIVNPPPRPTQHPPVESVGIRPRNSPIFLSLFFWNKEKKHSCTSGPLISCLGRKQVSDTEQPLRCSIASTLIVPSPPPKPRLSERALHPHPHVPLLRPAYLRPPFLSKRKLFWVLPIHLSLAPSSPGPCALPEPSASPIPFPIYFILNLIFQTMSLAPFLSSIC